MTKISTMQISTVNWKRNIFLPCNLLPSIHKRQQQTPTVTLLYLGVDGAKGGAARGHGLQILATRDGLH